MPTAGSAGDAYLENVCKQWQISTKDLSGCFHSMLQCFGRRQYSLAAHSDAARAMFVLIAELKSKNSIHTQEYNQYKSVNQN